jgi:hypothetical protein
MNTIHFSLRFTKITNKQKAMFHKHDVTFVIFSAKTITPGILQTKDHELLTIIWNDISDIIYRVIYGDQKTRKIFPVQDD